MDTIAARDWGVYATFAELARERPEILPVMQIAYLFSSYAFVSLLILLAILLFDFQGKRRAALVVLGSFLTALVLVEGMRTLVPSYRPPDAQNWLGPAALQGSFPAPGVFMFILSANLLALALWNPLKNPWRRGLYVLIAALLATWVCLSQFFLAIHFLTDVIGGIVGAFLVSWIALVCVRRDLSEV